MLREIPRYGDERGAFSVLYEYTGAHADGLVEPFVQDNHSLSVHRHTLRGIHLQLPPFEQGKLVTVLRGRILDAVVDLRPGSPTLGRHEVFEISSTEAHQLWVPRGFGHGFCTLEPNTEVLYKVDAPYHPEAERSLAWDDPKVAIRWPEDLTRPFLSAKDARGVSYDEIVSAITDASIERPVGVPVEEGAR